MKNKKPFSEVDLHRFSNDPEYRTLLLDLKKYFESAFRKILSPYHPSEILVQTVIDKTVLDKADYTVSFPGFAFRLTDTLYLNPAVCYHFYELLSGRTIAEPVYLSAQQLCYRNESSYSFLKRMYAFTVYEGAVIGSNQDVEGFRKGLIDDVYTFASGLKLEGTIEKSSDPFFVSDENKGKILLQKLYPLKFELRLKVDAHESIAVASFNNHQGFFGNTFKIKLPNGEPAHSGCVAFGLERWVYAFLRYHGLDRNKWPQI